MKKFLLLTLFTFTLLTNSKQVQSQEDNQIKVITFNTYGGDTSGSKVEAIANFLDDQNPDIFFLQEIDSEEYFLKIRNKLIELGWKIDSSKIRRINNARTDSQIDYHSVVYSRWGYQSLTEISNDASTSITNFIVQPSFSDPIRFFHNHPSSGASCIGALKLLEYQSNYTSQAKFLAGDFNLTYTANCYSEFAKNGFSEACDINLDPIRCSNTVNRVVWCQNFPNQCPEGPSVFPDSAIDHIFYQPESNWSLIDSYVDSSIEVSDHYPVVATFGFQYTPPTIIKPPENVIIPMVQQYYKQFLGWDLPANDSGVVFHADLMRTQGCYTDVKYFINSQEFKDGNKKNTTNQEYVSILYRAILSKEPDGLSNGSDWWVGQLDSEVLNRDTIVDRMWEGWEPANVCRNGKLLNSPTNTPIPNSPTPIPPPDMNQDGITNIFDLNILVNNFSNWTRTAYNTILDAFNQKLN